MSPWGARLRRPRPGAACVRVPWHLSRAWPRRVDWAVTRAPRSVFSAVRVPEIALWLLAAGPELRQPPSPAF